MTVLSGKTIRVLCEEKELLTPWSESKIGPSGMSYGLSHAGYDVRLDSEVILYPGDYKLGATLERFNMPKDVLGIVHDKSTLARQAITVQNTVIEPGWQGYLTVEIAYHASFWKMVKSRIPFTGRFKWGNPIILPAGVPIAQVVFHRLDQPVEGYSGKYQNQEAGPQEARFSKET